MCSHDAEMPGSVEQSEMCLTADPGVMSLIMPRSHAFTSLILAWSHTFLKIDHEIFSMVILLPSSDLRRVVVSYKRKYVQEALLSC